MPFVPNVLQFYRHDGPASVSYALLEKDNSPKRRIVEITDRAANVIEVSRSLIGTKFQLNARDGAALDCGGLVLEVCKRLNLSGSDLGRHYDLMDCGGHALYVHLRGYLNEVPSTDARPGDLLLLWIRYADYPQHLAIFTGSHMIHSNPKNAIRGVAEEPITEAWRNRIYAVFRFRGLKEKTAHAAPLHPHVLCEQCVRLDMRAYGKRRHISFEKVCEH